MGSHSLSLIEDSGLKGGEACLVFERAPQYLSKPVPEPMEEATQVIRNAQSRGFSLIGPQIETNSATHEAFDMPNRHLRFVEEKPPSRGTRGGFSRILTVRENRCHKSMKESGRYS